MTRLFHILKLESIFFNYYISLLHKGIVVESFTKIVKSLHEHQIQTFLTLGMFDYNELPAFNIVVQNTSLY